MRQSEITLLLNEAFRGLPDANRSFVHINYRHIRVDAIIIDGNVVRLWRIIYAGKWIGWPNKTSKGRQIGKTESISLLGGTVNPNLLEKR
jgi:hypothetical protein